MEQILINYTPTDDGFTLSVMAGEKTLFDLRSIEHEPQKITLQFIEGLQDLINKTIN